MHTIGHMHSLHRSAVCLLLLSFRSVLFGFRAHLSPNSTKCMVASTSVCEQCAMAGSVRSPCMNHPVAHSHNRIVAGALALSARTGCSSACGCCSPVPTAFLYIHMESACLHHVCLSTYVGTAGMLHLLSFCCRPTQSTSTLFTDWPRL